MRIREGRSPSTVKDTIQRWATRGTVAERILALPSMNVSVAS
jgi:hypothetical protein